ncbi:MAG TPA: M14 metallopeptidase family protein [Bryobacteraceae bacterium]|nr:M14 metallopeptidase family protein [Bryobacteraceae bacterium]
MTNRLCCFSALAVTFAIAFSFAQPAARITTPKEALGFNIGDDYMVAGYEQLEGYWKKLASESDRMKLVDIGPTSEGRRQYMAILTSPENLKKLDHYRDISRRLAVAEGLTDEQARALAREGKAVIWIDGGLHASETVGSQQLIETVYQLASRNDPETLRFLADSIVLCVIANPDGQEMVAKWYMREADPAKRSLGNLPSLYQKYAGHDDNRDFYASNLPETTNMNRVMFLEWFPQIIYDHHQTGPAGSVVFVPPFRDPFNYNLDPLIPLGVEMVGTMMHTRLVEQGKGGSAMRSAANYSTWWNGGLRTIAYFHNMIGILTEIVGNPSPIDIPLVADKQLPSGDWPLPVRPGRWHYRQSIDYDVELNRAVLDLASRYRENLLYDSYTMGRNSIENGSHDHWTITPKRIEALRTATQSGDSRNASLYDSILHDPKFRDPRGYILPADQADFPTATKFVNSLLKNGVTVLRATQAFDVAGKHYPVGSYVVKTAQAFRPQILDMFEPQDHPNDFAYPGGPPKPPYDIAGWTLAMQMGVQYDRVLDGFDGPFQKIDGLLSMPPAKVTGASNPVGFEIPHSVNNSFIEINRLLKAGCDVYWLKQEAGGGQAGDIWVPATPMASATLARGSSELGVAVRALPERPHGDSLKLTSVRIGLFDQYGGLASSGWIRWVFDQFEFPYQVVYPRTLDAGDLKRDFDVLVFPDGAIRMREGGGGQPNPDRIPEQYRNRLGTITEAKTIPQLRKFVNAGGTVVTIGSSSALGEMLGLPAKDYLVEKTSNGKDRRLPREKFYVPGSLLKARIDNSDPLAYGMPSQVDVFFENHPVFRLEPNAALEHVSAVAWFSGTQVLDSGWAWGQQYLDGGAAVVEASLGAGKVFLLGPDVTFRGQPHATFKLLFNGVYYGGAKLVTLP